MAGVAHKPFKKWRRFLPQVHLCEDLAAQFKDAKAQPVAAGGAIALKQPRRLQVHHESVDRGLVQRQALGEVRHTHLRLIRSEGVQDGNGAFDRLDAVPARSVLTYAVCRLSRSRQRTVSHRERVSCSVWNKLHHY
jgi:hypothetical protein